LHFKDRIMNKKPIIFAGAALGLAASLSMAQAGGKDYEFQPVQTGVKSGSGGDVAVRLVQKAGGTPVANAVIFRSRLDMSPEDMGDMTGAVAPEPSGEPGVYRFKAQPTMAGKWALKLMAKVPGESETVEGAVIVTAKD
jgi:YtkA-like